MLAVLFFLIGSTRKLNSRLRPVPVIARVVPDNDEKRIRKYSGKWQNSLRHADEAVLAQRTPLWRFIPTSILR